MKFLIFISLLLFASSSFAQNVSGNLEDFHFNFPLEMVSVTLKNNFTGDILGTDSTDASGNYSIDYTIVGINEFYPIPSDFYLSNAYPNPFNPSTRIDFITPHQGKFTVRVFNIIGQLVYTRDFTLNAGNHAFNISGLGSSGVYLFNLSSDYFTATQKLVLLDGGRGNINVKVIGSGSGKLNKTAYDDLLIEFRKDGYSPIDTVVVWDLNLFVDGRLSQIPMSDTIMFFTSQNLIPTNTPANNASVVGSANGSTLFSGVTNVNGVFESFFIANYVTNPNDTTEKVYTPSMILVNVSRSNVVGESQEFVVDGSDISWMNDLQQTLINKNGNASGNVKNDVQQPVVNANVKLFNNDNNLLFGQNNTNTSGNYNINYVYQGYENDLGDVHTPINNLRLEASANNHNPETIVKPFANPVVTDFVLNRVAYEFNATLKLYKTLKGQVVTDLDSIMVQWPDGSIQGFANNGGVVQINKLLYTLNSDTSAQLFHNQPDKYLKWMVGHKVNPSRPDWLFQNENSLTSSKMPLNAVKQEGTIEVYMVPKWAFYGPDNNTLMDMDSPTIAGFFTRNSAYVSGFRSTAQYDTIDIAQPLFNQTNNEPIPQNHIDRALNEIQKFLTALQWSHKKLLNYRFTQIESSTDPFYLYLLNPNGRYLDNVNISTFYQGGPINIVNIATDGTKRIKYSTSKYNTGSSQGQIQEEVFDSMLNTNIDDTQGFILASNFNYTDLAQNMIGIAYIFKPGTRYKEPVE